LKVFAYIEVPAYWSACQVSLRIPINL
jgi:hypothetical protein